MSIPATLVHLWLFCVCVRHGSGFLCNSLVKFKGRPKQKRSRARVAKHEWTNSLMQRYTHRPTNWLPVNTNKSSSSSWNSTMKQLWVPAETDSPTHWASHRQTHTHALTHWYTYHTIAHTKPHSYFLCYWLGFLLVPVEVEKILFLISEIDLLQSERLWNHTLSKCKPTCNFQTWLKNFFFFLNWGMFKTERKLRWVASNSQSKHNHLQSLRTLKRSSDPGSCWDTRPCPNSHMVA